MADNIDIARDAGRQQVALVAGFCALVSVGAIFTQTERSLLPYGGLPTAFSAVPASNEVATVVPGGLHIISLTPSLLRSFRRLVPNGAVPNSIADRKIAGVPPVTGSGNDDATGLAPEPALPGFGGDTATLVADNGPAVGRLPPISGGFVNPLPGFPGVSVEETPPDTGTPPGDGSTPGTGTPPGTGTIPGSGPGSGPVTGAVPEPSTWGMLIAGLFMIGGAIRRQRRTIRAVRLS